MPDANRIDAERLAALIDGRLNEAEAVAVRAQLARADAETVAAYADAMAVASLASSGASSAPDVVPITLARTRRRWLAPAMAAVAAGLVAIALLQLPRARSSATLNITDGLRAHALGVPEWNAVRSSDASMSEHGRAVRMGILLVQYELAARASDSAAVTRAAMIAALLDGVPGGSAAAMPWTVVGSGGPVPNEQLRGLHAGIARSLVDADFLQLGAWLEGARSAAASNQPAWFDTNDVAPIAVVLKSPSLSAAERDALVEVQRVVAQRPLLLSAVSAATTAAEIIVAR